MPDQPSLPIPDPNRPLPADILRGLTSPRISRRSALQLGGASALAMALAACGVSGGKKTPGGGAAASSAADATKAFWAAQKQTGTLNFASWPLYIDIDDKTKKSPSLELFTKQTGIKVNYKEVIQDSGSYFAKIQPQLQAGQSTGYDLMIITNGVYLDKLIELDYLIALDHTAMPNFDQNAESIVKSPSYDPGNKYTMAWQSGITGIAYDPKRTGRELTSWADLTDAKFKGKIGMFADTADLPNSALLAVGVTPEKSTQDDWKKAADWLKQQKPLVRKYYEQEYIDVLSKGDLWASMAWSGDVFQANASGATLKFVVPSEGAPIWTDNMCIPKHAAHPRDAMTYMDFVYQPKIAAMLAEYINYITPVPASVDVIKQDAAAATGDDKTTLEDVVTSPLVFPTESDYAKLHRYRVLSAEEETVWNGLFEPIYQ